MPIELAQTALMQFLQRKNAKYYGKVSEVRDEVKGWLAYIPQTFPHYTRHTIEHSEEIVSQISQLLFKDGDVDSPVLPKLSGAEAYVLVISAFLHDSGMVASDQEKGRILATNEWKEWVTSGGGAARWKEIDQLRKSNQPADTTLRDFLADVQVRYLIAEFIRRRHHLRAGEVVREHQEKLGRFAFSDPSLTKTIADVCVAHGLRTHELFDSGRFPERRDVGGEKVNVRLLAILLRLGDLLDMKYDRACPLLLNAASPLPAESLAHWTQYQRIEHAMVSPDRIEIAATCQTQDEHRFLVDWCQWLVQEVHEAAYSMSRAERHAEWKPPAATLEGNDATIRIEPSRGATYFPSKWTFQLDADAVLKRLIYDAYDAKHVFVRELIQNAADANRCRMYDDLRLEGIRPPDYPTQVDQAVRERYPIAITSRVVDVTNPMSGEVERKQLLTIDDSGIGMDRHVIENYFLQVGRSFYISDEFRRTYGFTPTSKFGVGFLSSFAESDHIVVETYKPSSQDGAIRLTLTAPRSYLLTEKSSRARPGTSIELRLDAIVSDTDLLKMVRHWCKRLEFPVEVALGSGARECVRAETAASFSQSVPDLDVEGGVISLVQVPIDSPGIEGELYVVAAIDPEGHQDWTFARRRRDDYQRRHPRQKLPALPHDLRCIHGINLNPRWNQNSYRASEFASRADWRRSVQLTLARSGDQQNELVSSIAEIWRRVVHSHLQDTSFAAGELGWRYRAAIYGALEDAEPSIHALTSELTWIDQVKGVVRCYSEGTIHPMSVEELNGVPAIATWAYAGDRNDDLSENAAAQKAALTHSKSIPVIPPGDMRWWPFWLRYNWPHQNRIVKADRLDETDLWLIHWCPQQEPEYGSQLNTGLLPPDVFGVRTGSRDANHEAIAFNEQHAGTLWLQSFIERCRRGDGGLTIANLTWLLDRIQQETITPDTLRKLARTLELPDADDVPEIGTVVALEPT